MVFLIFAGLMVLSWLNPNHFPPWGSWHSEVLTFAAVMIASGGVLFPKGWRARRVLVPKAAFAVLFLALVVVLQAATAVIEFVGDAWVLMSYFALCIAAMTVGHKAVVSPKPPGSAPNATVLDVSSFATLLVVGGMCSVAIALAQSMDVWPTVSWIHRMPNFRRPGANLGQPNQLATLILFSIASLMYLYETRRSGALVSLLMAIVLMLGIAITESRTGLLSLALMSVWWVLMRRKVGFRLPLPYLLICLGFLVLGVWLWPLFVDIYFVNGVGGGSASSISFQAGTRIVIWPQLWEAAMLRPWLGWGVREVSEAHNAVLHQYAISEPFTYAHNLILELVVGMGIPLTTVFFGMTGLWLWRCLCNVKDVHAWYFVAALVPFGVHSMLEFPFAYAYLLAPAMMMVGMLEAQTQSEGAFAVSWRKSLVTWVLFCAALMWSTAEYVAVEEDFRIARFEAVRLGHTDERYQRPRIVMLTQLDALLQAPRIVPEAGMDPVTIDVARRVALHFPGPATQNRYALALALNGSPDEAKRQLLVIRAMHGESAYRNIKRSWEALAQQKHPELGNLKLP